MADWIADSQPYETPLAAAAPDYAKTAPSLGDAFGAMFQESSTITWAQRAVERGGQQGSSWFDQALTSIGAGQAGEAPPTPPPSPTLSAADANKMYAPEGTTITNKPISEGLAQVLGKQKAQMIEREGILSRYAANTNPVYRFATGTAAFLLDPLNDVTAFIPGIGEEAILSKLGYAGLREAPLGARVIARGAAGATAGAAAQVPLSALRYGVSQEEEGDYGLRQAALDTVMGAALNAVVHAGVAGPLGDLFKARADRSLPRDPVIEAPPQTRYQAMSTGVSQMSDGRSLDVTPVFDEAGVSSNGAQQQVRARYAEAAAHPEGVSGAFQEQAAKDVSEARYTAAGQKDIFQAIKDLGGMRVKEPDGAATAGPDVQGALEDVKRKPPGMINNKTGMSPEQMHEALTEQGWFGHGDVDDEALVDAIRKQASGAKVLHPDAQAAAERAASLSDEFTRAGIGETDDHATATGKLADFRAEQAMNDLRAQADALGVPHNENTSHEELLWDVMERQAVQHEPQSPADVAAMQERLYKNGFAPGMPQDEFDRANKEIYGQSEDGETAKAAEPSNKGTQNGRSNATANDKEVHPEARRDMESAASRRADAERIEEESLQRHAAIANERPKLIEAAAKSRKLPDTRGQGVQYHGARSEIGDLHAGYYNPDNIYGGFETFYTTDAADIAGGYGRKNPNAKIYEIKEKSPVKMFDMEQVRDEKDWGKFFGYDPADKDLPSWKQFNAEAVENALHDGKANLREIMDEMRSISQDYGYPKGDVQEIFSGIIDGLSDQGYGGMTHIGGLRTGRDPHHVQIYFKPHEQIEVREVNFEKGPPSAEAAAALQENARLWKETGEAYIRANAEAAAARAEHEAAVAAAEGRDGAVDERPSAQSLSESELDLADLERRWAESSHAVGDHLLPEEIVELQSTEAALARAEANSAAYDQAGSCLTGAGI